jgi:hypothetical protein
MTRSRGSLRTDVIVPGVLVVLAIVTSLEPTVCGVGIREHVEVLIRNESMTTATLTDATYDLVLMNGSLHYVADKHAVLTKALRASAPGAARAVSLFSTATPMHAEHTVVPVFPDDENGVVQDFYRTHRRLLHLLERDRPEQSHPGFTDHRHRHIKLVAEATPDEP